LRTTGQRDWHAGEVSLSGDLMLQAFTAGKVESQSRRPTRGPTLAKESECRQFDLIDSLAAVGRTVGIVGITQQQPLFHEKLDCIVSDSFAGIGDVAICVSGCNEIDDWGDSAQWSFGVRPGGIRLKVEQGKQRVGGGFVPLLRAKLQCRQDFNSLGEPLLPCTDLAGGFTGRHEDES
jgi:hypothetical protein